MGNHAIKQFRLSLLERLVGRHEHIRHADFWCRTGLKWLCLIGVESDKSLEL